jgi:GNAT superfamily N-acetyltransferase
MSNIVIRKARREDCQRIMQLVAELAEYEKAPEQVTVSAEHFAESGFGARPVWWAFVAEAEGRVVGFALWYVRYSTWKGQRMYLEDFYVEPAMRGRGIGAMLFEELIAETKRLNMNGMVWQVLEWNEPALNFYRKYGASLDPEWVNGSLETT